PKEALTVHANKARLPQNINMQVKKNYKLRTYGNFHYLNHLPFKPKSDTHKQSIYVKTLNKIHNRINPPVESKTPPLNPETKAFLDRYFQAELEGIDELTGMDIMSKWF
ncbi:MAG: hypothetical protein HKO93_01405, partial [Flavobacteriales bacterium]|nr:hypothetical protein [Flavobacteriales bacterium]